MSTVFITVIVPNMLLYLIVNICEMNVIISEESTSRCNFVT